MKWGRDSQVFATHLTAGQSSLTLLSRANQFVHPRLIFRRQRWDAGPIVTQALAVAAGFVGLVQHRLHVQAHVEITVGQRHADARQTLPQLSRIPLEAISPPFGTIDAD